MLWNIHATSFQQKNPESLTLNRVSLALAVFIKRPQAVPQIGAIEKYHHRFIPSTYCITYIDVALIARSNSI
jgi:hypothetical protein